MAIDRIHGGNVRGEGLIDFSVSINPLGPPAGIKKIITKNIDALARYPEPDSGQLKSALTSFHNIRKDNLLIGNGSIELIYLVPKALNAKRILIAVPTFSEYEFASRAATAKVFFTGIDIHKLIKSASRADMIFLCNPNNPTGSCLARPEVLPLLKQCKIHDVRLIVDEAFMDFVKDSDKTTMLYEAVNNRNLLVLRSLTKFFAIPGLRLGYMIGHKDMINRMSEFQCPWNVNMLAQLAGSEIIKEKGYIKRSKEFVLKEKEFLFNNLKKIQNLEAYPPNSNFIFCKLKNTNVGQLYQKLLKKGIVIRKCDNFRGLDDRFFRVAVRKRAENIKLMKALQAIL